MQDESVDKVEYIRFEDLPTPNAQAISQGSVSLGFQSKEWFIQFQTLSTPCPIQPPCARPTGTIPHSSSTNFCP